MAQEKLETDVLQCLLLVEGAGHPLPRAGQLNLGVPLDALPDMLWERPSVSPTAVSCRQPACLGRGYQSTSLLPWLIDTVPSNAQGHSATIL